ncbi:hypothetical protein NPIL_432791, partial [Nephila pilipes]
GKLSREPRSMPQPSRSFVSSPIQKRSSQLWRF